MGRRHKRRSRNGGFLTPVIFILFALYLFGSSFFFWIFLAVATFFSIFFFIQNKSERPKNTRKSRNSYALTNIEPRVNSTGKDIYSLWKSNEIKEEKAVETKWSLELLKKIEWKRFEEVVAEYFKLRGYVAETTKLGKDGGIDINIYGKNSNQLVSIVQCKAWSSYKVKLKEVRELLGAVTAKGVKQGIFITTSTFTKDAIEFAQENHLILIDGKEFLNEIDSLGNGQSEKLLSFATQGNYWIPSCPKCGLEMVERPNKKTGSKFWGCSRFPKCWGRLSISKDK